MAQVEHAPPSAAKAAPLVMLVEDEAALRSIVSRNLDARGYRVREVETVGGALAAIHQETPAVLLLDINLPDGSGWDVLRDLRAVGWRVPTVVISAVRCSQSRLEEFQPDCYLPKPFPLAALMSAVERLAGTSTDDTPPELTRPQAEGPARPETVELPERDGSAYRATMAETVAPPPAAPCAPNRQPQPLSEYVLQAMVDVAADQKNGIRRIRLVGTSPATAERLHSIASRRGLVVESAASPSLRQAWVRLETPAPAKNAKSAGKPAGRWATFVSWLLGPAGKRGSI